MNLKFSFKKENILTLAVIVVVTGCILGLAIGIPLFQTKSNLRRARELLDKYILIDGYISCLKMMICIFEFDWISFFNH